jgi:predicted transcriptional regulator
LDRLKQLKARDLMVDIIFVTPEATVLETIDAMLNKKSEGMLVVDEGILKGIVSTFDIIKWLKEDKVRSVHTKITDIMTEPVIYAYPDDDLKHVVDLMFDNNNRFVPVVSDNKPMGIITRKDIGTLFAENYGHKYRACDLMTYRYSTFSVNDTLAVFFRKIRTYDDKYSVIMSNDKVIGVVTPTNILNHLLQKSTLDIKTTIKELMTSNPYTAKPDDRCDNIANIMMTRDFSGVPIVDERLEGLIRYSCFLQFLEL